MDSSSSFSSPIPSPILPSIHPISVKLDRSNYSFWKTQVHATARAYGFDDVIQQNSAPMQHLLSEDGDLSPNPEYLVWLRRDQFIFSWLLTSISPSMIGYVGRCTTSSQLWTTFATLFHSQSKARSAQLRFQLQSMKKGNFSIEDYILKFRDVSDQLFNIGQQISEADLVNYILSGLGPEFESISVFLQSRCDELSLDDVQFSLQTHEIHLLNQAASGNTGVNGYLSQQTHQENAAYNQKNSIRGRVGRCFNNRGRGGGRYHGGNSGNNANKPICQLCGKQNHVAAKCYKRFDISFIGVDLDPPSPQVHNTIQNHHSPHTHTQNTSLPQHSNVSAVYFTAPASDSSTGADWYLDTGASAHVTFDSTHI